MIASNGNIDSAALFWGSRKTILIPKCPKSESLSSRTHDSGDTKHKFFELQLLVAFELLKVLLNNRYFYLTWEFVELIATDAWAADETAPLWILLCNFSPKIICQWFRVWLVNVHVIDTHQHTIGGTLNNWCFVWKQLFYANDSIKKGALSFQSPVCMKWNLFCQSKPLGRGVCIAVLNCTKTIL